MKKYVPMTAIFVLIALAGITYFATSNLLAAAFLATLAVVVWGFSPSGLGSPSSRKPEVGPAELKQYRRDHPGATISDAIQRARP